jgi:lysozyme
MKTNLLPVLLTIVLLSCHSSVENNATSDSMKSDSAMVSANTSTKLYGIDISQYQGDEVDFLNKKQDTLSFVICRATLGITKTDTAFKTNWALLLEKGFIRGAYHFYECDDNPEKQAQHYLTVVGTLSENDLPPVLDFEQLSLGSATNVQQIQIDLLTFLHIVDSVTGRTPMLYVGPGMANQYLTNPEFSKFPLYDADYDGQNQPQLPTLWQSTGWTFWQKTDKVTVDGDTTDFDVFNGDTQALQDFIHREILTN